MMFMTLCTTIASAQETVGNDSVMTMEKKAQAKAAQATKDSLERVFAREDSIELANAAKKAKQKRDWSTWRPDAKRALWLALAIPGAGQIYNRKYWKLPLVYGGFVGCIYAISWNNQMYHDYSQAYIDLVDDDPRTQSYNEFLHLGVTITDSNKSTYQELFRKRKDRYRRWRDLSVFALVAVYALSVIDAYVDASLSEFDISKDLSLRIAPTVLNDQSSAEVVGCGRRM